MTFHHSLRRLLLVLFLAAGVFSPEICSAEFRAIVVAVSKYDHLPKEKQLPFCETDADAFLRVLVERTGVVKREDVLLISENAERRDHRPAKANVEQRIEEFLQKCNPNDVLLYYHTGHGSYDKNTGRSILLPSDFDSRLPDKTGIDLGWLRQQLLNAPVRARIVLLDACHAGGISGAGTKDATSQTVEGITAKDIGVVFRESDSFYAIASCDHRESSAVWVKKNMSVFTYWLNLGLQGGADENANGKVSMDELFHFLESHVPRTAHMLASPNGAVFRQTPRRVCGGERLGNPDLFPVSPEPAADTFRRIGELTADLIEHHLDSKSTGDRPTLYVHEFTNRIGDAQEYGGSLGTLGRVAAMRTEAVLTQRAGRLFEVMPRELIEPDCVHLDRDGFQALRDRVDLVVGGEFSRRGNLTGDSGPDRLQFHLRIYRAKTGAYLENISLSLLVDDELWAMLGGSGEFPRVAPDPAHPQAVSPVSPAPAVVQLPATTHVPPRIRNEVSRQRNPVVEPRQNAPFRIVIRKGTAGETRVPVDFLADPENPNRALFGLLANDEFEIEFENDSDDYVSVVFLVDGLNVLNRSPETPKEARSWLFPGKSKLPIMGWATGETAVGGKVLLNIANFVATSPSRSVAGRKQRTADLGIIQVVVFAAEKVPPYTRDPLGIGEGTIQIQDFTPITDYRPNHSNMLATYTLRYVDESCESYQQAKHAGK